MNTFPFFPSMIAEITKYQQNILNIIFINQNSVFVSKTKLVTTKKSRMLFWVKNVKYPFGIFGSIYTDVFLGLGVPEKQIKVFEKRL